MADTFQNPRPSGRAPGDQNTYNPIAGTDFPPGTPVAQSPSADKTVVPADASTGTGSTVTGLAVAPGVAGNPVHIQQAGPVTLTTEQWDEVTGQSGGLTRCVRYYLDTDSGKLTSSAPQTGGTFQVPIGIATSATDLLLVLGTPLEN